MYYIIVDVVISDLLPPSAVCRPFRDMSLCGDVWCLLRRILVEGHTRVGRTALPIWSPRSLHVPRRQRPFVVTAAALVLNTRTLVSAVVATARSCSTIDSGERHALVAFTALPT